MRKPTTKTKSLAKDKFTAREVGTLIDEFRGEFRVFGERQKGIIEELHATHEQVGKNAEDIALLKVAVKDMAAKIDALTQSIDKLIKTKIDREELQTLDKRVSVLEAKIASLSR